MGKNGGEEEAVANHVSGQANTPMSKPAHALTFEEVASELGADIQNGLSSDEHKTRLEKYGRNEFGETEGVQPVRIFVGQLANALTMVSLHLLISPGPTIKHQKTGCFQQKSVICFIAGVEARWMALAQAPPPSEWSQPPPARQEKL
jgi:magnesium-transporting ATPase (P-type)